MTFTPLKTSIALTGRAGERDAMVAELDKLDIIRTVVENEIQVLFGEQLDFTLIVWPTDGNVLIDGTVERPEEVCRRLAPHG